MDRHLLVLSLEAVVDKVEEVEEVREEVPSLDHTSGARANDLAELCLCVLFRRCLVFGDRGAYCNGFVACYSICRVGKRLCDRCGVRGTPNRYRGGHRMG